MRSIIAPMKRHIIPRRKISEVDHWSTRNVSRALQSASHQIPYLYNRWHIFQYWTTPLYWSSPATAASSTSSSSSSFLPISFLSVFFISVSWSCQKSFSNFFETKRRNEINNENYCICFIYDKTPLSLTSAVPLMGVKCWVMELLFLNKRASSVSSSPFP